MNIENLKLMQTMLAEVTAGTWRMIDGVTYVGKPVDGNINFNLRSWFDDMTDGCGFSACAVGHAAVDARFNALGWSLDRFQPQYINPVNDTRLTSWDAVETFFDIGDRTSALLFMERCYLNEFGAPVNVSPAMVNARIETLIQFGEDEFCARGDKQ